MSESSIDHVALTVRDLNGMSRFYETVLGLDVIATDDKSWQLGCGNQALLELRANSAASPRDPRQAGLFHVAYLLPGRGDLSQWLRHATETGQRLSGASDHGVSEALYLDDPEGNGIEIYWDRPEADWKRNGERIEMFTHRLDLNALAAHSDKPWQKIPGGSKIGHVHLQVGDTVLADAFFRNQLGLTQTFDAPGGGWYGWQGYHHHLAGNQWNSSGATLRDANMAGLAEIVLHNDERVGEEVTDPWGTRFRFV